MLLRAYPLGIRLCRDLLRKTKEAFMPNADNLPLSSVAKFPHRGICPLCGNDRNFAIINGLPWMVRIDPIHTCKTLDPLALVFGFQLAIAELTLVAGKAIWKQIRDTNNTS